MTPDDLGPAAGRRLDVVLRSLIDTKLLLGYRYTAAVHDTPSMEDMNAIQGQAANEFGQAKHLIEVYTAAFEADRAALETRRDPIEYANLPALDEGPDSWPAILGVVGVADMAAHVRLRSFADARWAPVAGPAGKAIQEEEFHSQYLIGALETLARSRDAVAAVAAAVDRSLDGILPWFGPSDEPASTLVTAGYLATDPDGERDLLLTRLRELDESVLGGVLQLENRDPAIGHPADWDPDRGRTPGGPEQGVVDDLALEGIEGGLTPDP